MRITAEQVRRLQYPHKEFLDELNRIYENIKFLALSNPIGGYHMSFYYYPSDDNCSEKEVLYRIKNALEMDGYEVKLVYTSRGYYRLYIDWAK